MTLSGKWLTAGIAAASAGVLTGSALLILPHRIEAIEPAPEFPQPPQETVQAQLPQTDPLPDPPEQETAYLLKLRGDTLYVYEEGAREASEQYDLPAGWLPDYDRILLEYGMRCTGEQEMRSLVEDYVS